MAKLNLRCFPAKLDSRSIYILLPRNKHIDPHDGTSVFLQERDVPASLVPLGGWTPGRGWECKLQQSGGGSANVAVQGNVVGNCGTALAELCPEPAEWWAFRVLGDSFPTISSQI